MAVHCQSVRARQWLTQRKKSGEWQNGSQSNTLLIAVMGFRWFLLGAWNYANLTNNETFIINVIIDWAFCSNFKKYNPNQNSDSSWHGEMYPFFKSFFGTEWNLKAHFCKNCLMETLGHQKSEIVQGAMKHIVYLLGVKDEKSWLAWTVFQELSASQQESLESMLLLQMKYEWLLWWYSWWRRYWTCQIQI